MKERAIRLLHLAVIASLGCAQSAKQGAATRPPGSDNIAQPNRGAMRWTDSVLERLSLRERAAQMVWPSIIGDYVANDDPRWARIVEWVRDDAVGGFTVSVGSPFDIAAKLDAMQRISAVPLLFGADFEAGVGFRARGGVFLPNAIELGGATWTPPLMALGATADTSLAYQLGRMTAIEGRALGVHLVYGPVLDVNSNAANPVINVRSFGEDPALVARMGAAFIRGVQENGMYATGKHFPGHGDTEVNSHLALPEVTASRARLDSVELVPFRAAIRTGVRAIMTFHGALPALDSSGVPATLSAAILSGLLRRDLGFQGIEVTDAMDMRGVLDRYGAVEAAQRAVAAGADVLIQPEDVRATIDAIVAGVASGRYPASRVMDAARRVLSAKSQLIGDRRQEFDADAIRRVVGTAAHRALADTIAARALTLVCDTRAAVPLHIGARVLSVTVASRAELTAGTHFDAALREARMTVRSLFVDADAGDAQDYARVRRAADSADVVVVSSYVATRWDAATIAQSAAFVDFVREISASRTPMVLVAFGNPYLLQQVPSVPAYLVGWSGVPASQRSAARALAGLSAVSGRLPISIPPVAMRGAGLRRTPIR